MDMLCVSYAEIHVAKARHMHGRRTADAQVLSLVVEP